MSTLTLAPATDGQVRQLARVASDAAEKAVRYYENLSKDGAQRVHGNPEFAVRIREATILAIAELSVSDRYADEEERSSYTYPNEYDGPKPIEEQIKAIAEIFSLDPMQALEYAKHLPELPAGAEGWFAIPKWQTIAPTYAEAVHKVLDAIKQARNGKFYNYRDGQIVNERLRQSVKTEAVFQKLCEEQKDHDILVVAAQFGLRHRGRSVRRAREVMQANECGLGAFAVGIMLLTHSKRLSHYDDLWIDCVGDEYSPGAGDRFDFAPRFSFRDGGVRFDARWVDDARDFYGSVSAFLPQ